MDSISKLTIGAQIVHSQKDRSGRQNVVDVTLHEHVEVATIIGFDFVLLSFKKNIKLNVCNFKSLQYQFYHVFILFRITPQRTFVLALFA